MFSRLRVMSLRHATASALSVSLSTVNQPQIGRAQAVTLQAAHAISPDEDEMREQTVPPPRSQMAWTSSGAGGAIRGTRAKPPGCSSPASAETGRAPQSHAQPPHARCAEPGAPTAPAAAAPAAEHARRGVRWVILPDLALRSFTSNPRTATAPPTCSRCRPSLAMRWPTRNGRLVAMRCRRSTVSAGGSAAAPEPRSIEYTAKEGLRVGG